MKIAIISNVPRTGKTVAMLSLAHVFSRSQERTAAIFATASLKDVIENISRANRMDNASTPGVLRAFLETGSISGKEILDYAVRSGRDSVYIYDTIDSQDSNASMEFLVRTMRTVSTELIIVEINGDPSSDNAKRIIHECDVVMNVFNPDTKSIAATKSYIASLDKKMVGKMTYLCNMYDDRALSEKKLSGLLQIPQKMTSVLTYNPSIVRLYIEGDYDLLADRVVYGHEDFTLTRTELLKEMQMFYDSGNRKIIRPIKDWPKRQVF